MPADLLRATASTQCQQLNLLRRNAAAQASAGAAAARQSGVSAARSCASAATSASERGVTHARRFVLLANSLPCRKEPQVSAAHSDTTGERRHASALRATLIYTS